VCTSKPNHNSASTSSLDVPKPGPDSPCAIQPPRPWLLAPLLKYTGTQGQNNRSAEWQKGHGVVDAEICSGNLRAGYNCNDRTQHPALLNPPTT